MKKLLLSLSLALCIGSSLYAGTVTLTWTSDSLMNPCLIPQRLGFNVGGTATGYGPGDSIDVYVAFGDGHDTTVRSSIFNNDDFYAWVNHTYTMPGTYTVMYVAIGPDMDADTLIVPNEVILGNSCDNISGKVYLDDNGDCTFGAQDVGMPGKSVKLKMGGQVVLQTYTDQNGDYSFSAVTGITYTVEIGSSQLTLNCPQSGSYTVSTFPGANLDFALECPSSGYDLESRYNGGFLVPGVARPVSFNVRNNLCDPVSGVAKLVLGSGVSYVPGTSSYLSVPDSINGDTLYFGISQSSVLHPTWIRVDLKGDTTLTINDSVCVQLIAEPVAGDADVTNNIASPCLEVRTSYDPNMKAVYPAGEGADGLIEPDQTMMYTIHFQNTGNFMATNIFILDTIDTQTLDLNTLEVLDYSHPMTLQMLNNNILRFNFDNIMLADSNSNEPESHGYVSFRIDQKAALPDGSKIKNTAAIFFDYNPPIITNTATNTISRTIGIEEVGGTSGVQLFEAYPNPASEVVNIHLMGNRSTATLELFDLNGRKVISTEVKGSGLIDVSLLPAGVYILKVSDEESAQQKRLVIQ